MTKDEALKLALETLEYAGPSWIDARQPAITAIKEALAQPDPVKIDHKHEWFRTGEMKVGQMRCISCGTWGQEEMPQRTWVGLTNDELTDLFYNENLGQESAVSQAIALLKERNT